MPLERVERVLLALHAVEEAVVVAEQEDGARQLVAPGAARVEDAELWADDVAVLAEVEELVLLVLAERQVDRDPGALRIAWWSKSMRGTAIDPECRAAAENAAALCAELVHTVEEAIPPVDADMITDAFLTIWAAGATGARVAPQRATGRKGDSFGRWSTSRSSTTNSRRWPRPVSRMSGRKR